MPRKQTKLGANSMNIRKLNNWQKELTRKELLRELHTSLKNVGGPLDFNVLNKSDSRCLHLQPAGTGSSVTNAFLRTQGYQYMRHKHKFSCHNSPKFDCFFLNLRDPVERLESGFRYSLHDKFWKNKRLTKKEGRALLKTNASTIIDTLQKAFSHGKSLPKLRAILKRYINDNFLWKQITYLHCRRGDVIMFPVCKEWLRADIGSYFRDFPTHRNLRTNSSDLIQRSMLFGFGRRQFVRNVLFPDDQALHTFWCSRTLEGA